MHNYYKFMIGKFITFEGSERCGKSTQSKLLCEYLEQLGRKVVFLREPGGTIISEKIRQLLLDEKNNEMVDETELLLYMASRAQTVKQLIIPAIKDGKIVVCDRFLDSTIVYQGYGLGMDLKVINFLGELVTFGIKPDLTVLLDLPLKEALDKIGDKKDRIEQRSFEYHTKVRNGYLALAEKEPKRVKLIKVEQNIKDTQEKIRKAVDEILK